VATHRVFVIWTNPLFHESVRRLLAHPDVEWVGEASDYVAAQGNIAALQPDTVLVEAVENNISQVLDILRASHGNVRIISLGLADNSLSLYQHQEQVVAKAEDLLFVLLDKETPMRRVHHEK
jgi:AmiR/NasT family two-component response regulator